MSAEPLYGFSRYGDSLSTFASIHPNIPRLLFIQTLLFPARTYFLREQALVVAIVPLGDILGDRHLALLPECIFLSIAEQQIEGLLRALAGAGEDVGESGGIYDFA